MSLGIDVAFDDISNFKSVYASEQMGRTHRCMVTPKLLRSLTLRTLLIMSRPRSSKTKTFHIGSPSVFRMGAVLGVSPFVVTESNPFSEDVKESRLRLRISSIDARKNQY